MDRERYSRQLRARTWVVALLIGCCPILGCATFDLSGEFASPDGPTASDEILAGDRLRDEGRIPDALMAYMRAYRIDDSEAEPRERIAYLHLRKRPERAVRMFRELVARNPESASAHRGLGLAQMAMDDLKTAEGSLSRSIELDPNSGTAHSALGVIYDRTGSHDTAKDHYWKAMILRPDDYEIPNNLGVSFMITRDYTAAVEVFREAVRMNPDDEGVHNNLGLALGMLEEYDEALQAFRAGSDETAALNNLGYVYFLNGHYDAAIERYQRALLVNGGDKAAVLRNLSRAQQAAELRRGPTDSELAAP